MTDLDITTVPVATLPATGKPNDDVEHAEEKKDTRHDDHVVMKSPFEDLGFWDTLIRFRKATLIALVAAFSAAAE